MEEDGGSGTKLEEGVSAEEFDVEVDEVNDLNQFEHALNTLTNTLSACSQHALNTLSTTHSLTHSQYRQ